MDAPVEAGPAGKAAEEPAHVARLLPERLPATGWAIVPSLGRDSLPAGAPEYRRYVFWPART